MHQAQPVKGMLTFHFFWIALASLLLRFLHIYFTVLHIAVWLK